MLTDGGSFAFQGLQRSVSVDPPVQLSSMTQYDLKGRGKAKASGNGALETQCMVMA